jgi:hypothetical protein
MIMTDTYDVIVHCGYGYECRILMRSEEGYQRRLSLENLGDHYIVLI